MQGEIVTTVTRQRWWGWLTGLPCTSCAMEAGEIVGKGGWVEELPHGAPPWWRKSRYSHHMREGRFFGYSVRQISRAIGGTIPEATLRRWATDAEDITAAILIDVSERDALIYARVYAAAAGLVIHKGTSRALAEQLLRHTPLPKIGYLTLTGTRIQHHPNSNELAAHLERARETTTVIPLPRAHHLPIAP